MTVAYMEDYDMTIVLDDDNNFINFYFGIPDKDVTPLYLNKDTLLKFLKAIGASISNI